MQEPVSAETQQANSPARQLLAALTRASQDMEKSVSESYEYVTRLNNELEQVVNAQLKESQQLELYLRGHQDGISSERDSILSQLTELRQEELRVLQATGKNLRQALVEKLNNLVTAFRADVDVHLQAFQEKLSRSDSENNTAVEATRKMLLERMPGYISSLNQEVGKEKLALEEQHGSYQTTLAQQSNDSLNELVEHQSELKARLESEGEAFLAAVDGSATGLIAEQTEKLNQQIESFCQSEQKAGERIDSLSRADKTYIKELPGNFEESCREMAELQVGLHATLVKNLALQYRTEILSAAQEAEDQLQIVRSELQSVLRQYQSHYCEQFENLLARFEKSATDFANTQMLGTDLSANRAQILENINERFAALKKTISENSREKVSSTETAMEKSYEEFRLRLENARKESCEKIESNFKENQDELARLQQSNEEQLNELSNKLEELELAVAEAKELIRALDQPSWSFEEQAMSKSLKDIVEDGFARLSVLSEKRKKLLARCDELSDSTTNRQCQQGLHKLESTQESYSQEVSAYAKRSQEVLQQTLSQIIEDNDRFLSSVKENLQLRIARVLKELAYTRAWILSGSSEKFVSCLRPLESEVEAGTTDLRFESLKVLGDLEAVCKRSQSSLHEIQAEIAGKLSSREHELTGLLSSEFTALVKESELRKQKVTESIEKLYSEQASQMTSLTEDMDERISSIVTQHLEAVESLGTEAEESLQETSQRVLSSATSDIVSLSQESFSELEASYEYSHQELTDNLADLRAQTEQLLNQLRQSLQELELTTREAGDNLSQKLKSRPAVSLDSGATRSPVADTIRQLSRELDLSNSDFKRQLNELLRIQQERLSNLCLSAENSISATAGALNAELKQLTKLHEQSWSDREQEMLSRLRKLEKETQETRALVGDSGSTDHGAAN